MVYAFWKIKQGHIASPFHTNSFSEKDVETEEFSSVLFSAFHSSFVHGVQQNIVPAELNTKLKAKENIVGAKKTLVG